MSNGAISAVLDRSQSTGTARLILVILADYANEHGVAWPSTVTLAQKANTTKRNVLKTLSKLEIEGEIVRVGMGIRGVIKYRISVVTGELQDTSEPEDTSELQDTPTGVPQDTSTGELQDTQPLTKPLLDPLVNISEKAENEKTRRGTKLNQSWKPSEQDRDYARGENWTEAEIDRERQNFVEHFTNGNGRKQSSPNWSLRWQRWVRTNYAGNGKDPTAKRRKGFAAALDDLEVRRGSATGSDKRTTGMFAHIVESDNTAGGHESSDGSVGEHLGNVRSTG